MYILYKNPIQLETLQIVQYLHSQNITLLKTQQGNIPLLPTAIVERSYPSFISHLPTIVCQGIKYEGLEGVVLFYETGSGINGLLEKSAEFKKQNPKYTIKP